MLMIDGWGTSGEIDLRWLLLGPTDGKATLVHVMAWWPRHKTLPEPMLV